MSFQPFMTLYFVLDYNCFEIALYKSRQIICHLHPANKIEQINMFLFPTESISLTAQPWRSQDFQISGEGKHFLRVNLPTQNSNKPTNYVNQKYQQVCEFTDRQYFASKISATPVRRDVPMKE